jgi:peroxiredoxin
MTDLTLRDYTQAGPQIGERFPDIVLPDQSGTAVNLHEARRRKRAIIVFHRSARW